MLSSKTLYFCGQPVKEKAEKTFVPAGLLLVIYLLCACYFAPHTGTATLIPWPKRQRVSAKPHSDKERNKASAATLTDFSSSSIEYVIASIHCRFDLLAGFNTLETGRYIPYVGSFLSARGENLTEGGSLEAMSELTRELLCEEVVTSLAVDLCTEYVIDLYDMGASTNPVQRVKNFLTAMSM